MRGIERRSFMAGGAALAGALAAPPIAHAQAWPEGRTITLIVPFPPGGGTDVVTRVIADRLAAALKCRFVVENRPGGGGSIGYLAAIKAPPDGSVMMLTSSAIATMPYLYPSKGYDPLRDLLPVSQVGTTPSLICVGPSLKVATLRDLIAEAKARPDELTYASAGIGSGLHLGAETFNKMAGIRVKHVPYKGASLATSDLLGGRIDMIVDALPSVQALVADGKLKALAITTTTRSKLAPDVPPAAETVPGYDYSAWFGLFLPAKAPAGMAEEVQAALAKVIPQADFQEKTAVLGIETVGSTPGAFRSFMEADLARWQKVIKELGITADG
jgi:tripartite-type tricarboxylate transporter receptor subunit TctC